MASLQSRPDVRVEPTENKILILVYREGIVTEGIKNRPILYELPQMRLRPISPMSLAVGTRMEGPSLWARGSK